MENQPKKVLLAILYMLVRAYLPASSGMETTR